MPVNVVSFGCRLNIHESEVIKQEADKAGLGASHERTIIFNTCAVTAEAVRQVRQAIRKARRESPQARIIVTGCAAQTAPQDFAKMEEVDLVLGNQEKIQEKFYQNFNLFGTDITEKAHVNDIMSVTETAHHMINAIDGHVRGFIQIQNGCNHRCTFCIIPYARGNSRSVPIGRIVEQIKRLTGNGYCEIVLTGVDLTAYGFDLPGSPSLGYLVKTLFKQVPDIKRLRLSSIDCIETDNELMEVIATEKRLMPHLHLSLQAGDNLILKRMKRRHLREDAIQFCETIRKLRPQIVFGADIIAGFPTEKEAMFEKTLQLIQECKLTHLHIFRFSPRENTPAARMPQLNREIIKKRASILRRAGQNAYLEHLERQKDVIQSILIEKKGVGRTEDFTLCALDVGNPGDIIPARIVGHDGKRLMAIPI